jgi:hypothetical protein
MTAKIVCQGCGTEFEAKRSDRVWCDTCRAKRRKESYDRYDFTKHEVCPDCGEPMVRRAEYCLRCSNKRRGEKRQAENNGYWKGGTTQSTDGYVYVRANHTSGAGAYRPRHYLVWEQTHGQPLPKGWVVHHLNGIKGDDRPENLVGMSRGDHHRKPREALRPYEECIRQLEEALRKLRGD